MSTGDNRRLLIFRYENQENQVKFKVKTFFKSLLFKNENQENRNDFIFWLNYTIVRHSKSKPNQLLNAALELKTFSSPGLNVILHTVDNTIRYMHH